MMAPMPRLKVKKACPMADRITELEMALASKWNMKRIAAGMSAATIP